MLESITVCRCLSQNQLVTICMERWRLEALYSVEEAARLLGGLSKYTIHAWLSSGKLRRTKVGRRTMIRESELKRIIEDGGKSPGRRDV